MPLVELSWRKTPIQMVRLKIERRKLARMTPEERHAYRNQQAYLALLREQRRYHKPGQGWLK